MAKKVGVSPRPTDLESRMTGAAQAGGGIQPGAHPEFDKPTPIGNPMKQIGEVLRRTMKPKATGNSDRDRHNRRAWEFENNKKRGSPRGGPKPI